MFIKKKKIEATDTREILLQTASRLFAEKGFEAVSIRELSKEANVNIAMIAYHFGSKEGLFKAIVGEKIPKMTAQLKNIQKSEGTAWDKISAIIDIYIERMFNNGVFNKLVFRELSLEQRPEHRETILSGVEGNWKIVKTFIEEGQKNGLFKVPSLRNVALTAPYMHDGRFKTLMNVVNHYDHDLKPHENLMPSLRSFSWQGNGGGFNSGGSASWGSSTNTSFQAPRPLMLTASDKTALADFLKTLSDDYLAKEEKFSNPFKL